MPWLILVPESNGHLNIVEDSSISWLRVRKFEGMHVHRTGMDVHSAAYFFFLAAVFLEAAFAPSFFTSGIPFASAAALAAPDTAPETAPFTTVVRTVLAF